MTVHSQVWRGRAHPDRSGCTFMERSCIFACPATFPHCRFLLASSFSVTPLLLPFSSVKITPAVSRASRIDCRSFGDSFSLLRSNRATLLCVISTSPAKRLSLHSSKWRASRTSAGLSKGWHGRCGEAFVALTRVLAATTFVPALTRPKNCRA